MCTIVVATGLWKERVVVAANRDEALDRPSEPPAPRASGEFADLAVLCPRDLRSGGTWLGVNQCGLFVGITNRAGSEVPSGGVSRGTIVSTALGAKSPSDAMEVIEGLDPRSYAGFHLVVANADALEVIWGDGVRFHRDTLGPGFHAFTERSYGAAPTSRFALIETRTKHLRHAFPGLSAFRELLEDDGDGAGFEGILVETDKNYGTRSSAVIELGPKPSFWYRGRRPSADETPWLDFTPQLRAVLAST